MELDEYSTVFCTVQKQRIVKQDQSKLLTNVKKQISQRGVIDYQVTSVHQIVVVADEYEEGK